MALLTCDNCLKNKPSDQFSNLSKGTICKACLGGYAAAKKESDLAIKAKDIAKKLIDVENPEILKDPGAVKNIIADIYDHFGGPHGFASHIHWIIMELSKRKPIPSSVGNLMLGIIKLHQVTEQAETDLHVQEMTDEQLKREHEIAMLNVVMDATAHPEKRKALEEILNKRGLKVIETKPEEEIVPSEDEFEKFLKDEP